MPGRSPGARRRIFARRPDSEAARAWSGGPPTEGFLGDFLSAVSRRRVSLALPAILLALSVVPGSATQGPAYPRLLADVMPGPGGSWPDDFVVTNDRLFFSASSSGEGTEVWTSDGTAEGTHIVRDVNPGPSGSNPQHLTAIGDSIFFAADDGAHGLELWKSDGTSEGTVLVKDINPGSAGHSVPAGFTVRDGIVFFAADDGTHGTELWRTDGTESGTWMVKDILTGSFSHSSPDYFSVLGDSLMFRAYLGDGVFSIWKTDGTETGTSLVATLPSLGPPPWRIGVDPDGFVVAGDLLFFAAHAPGYGKELWRSDGTTNGTFRISDISPGEYAADPGEMTAIGDKLFFTAYLYDGALQDDRGLWVSDGTAGGTLQLTLFWRRAGGRLKAVGSTLFFAKDDWYHGIELWRSDGTIAGTALVEDIYPNSYGGGPGSSPSPLVAYRNLLVFTADDGAHGRELFTSDGTAAGTSLLVDTLAGTDSYGVDDLVSAAGLLFFSGDDRVHGREPIAFPIDRTPPETVITSAPPDPNGPAASFFFHGVDDVGGTRIYCSLDSAPYAACASPLRLDDLAEGEHTFFAYAVDTAGNADATPATHTSTQPDPLSSSRRRTAPSSSMWRLPSR